MPVRRARAGIIFLLCPSLAGFLACLEAGVSRCRTLAGVVVGGSRMWGVRVKGFGRELFFTADLR